MLRRGPGDSGSCSLAAGEGHAAHAGIGDHLGDLVVIGEDVHVGVVRYPGVVQEPGHHLGGAGADLRVLEDDRVAGHQVGGDETCHLVVRIVPGHHADQRADRLGLHERLLGPLGVQLLVPEQLRAVRRVPAVDRAGQLGLADPLRQGLAHLRGDQSSQLLRAGVVGVSDALEDLGASLRGRPPPVREGGVRPSEHVLHARGVQRGELLVGSSRGRVGRGVSSHAPTLRAHPEVCTVRRPIGRRPVRG